MLANSIFALLSLAATSHGHATFQDFWVGSTDMKSTCVRLPLSNNPVASVTTTDLACNVNGNNASPSTCTVAAGSSVTAEMHQQPGDRTCTTEAIGGDHDGPTIIYMAKVDNAATAIGANQGWFKVAQTGYVSGQWGTQIMNANCGKVTFTIPSDIAPGAYLIRAEVIALHVAGSIGGAQFYMSCIQVQVTGSGNAYPATVKFPGAYSATDPGILFDLYGGFTSYTVPGPPVYTGGGSTSVPPASPTTSTTSAPSSTPTGPVIPKYGQCGGATWTGGSNCAPPSTCVKSNDYYSQCL